MKLLLKMKSSELLEKDSLCLKWNFIDSIQIKLILFKTNRNTFFNDSVIKLTKKEFIQTISAKMQDVEIA